MVPGSCRPPRPSPLSGVLVGRYHPQRRCGGGAPRERGGLGSPPMGSKRGRESGPPKLKSNIWFKCPPPSCLSERSTTVVRFWPGPPGTPPGGPVKSSKRWGAKPPHHFVDVPGPPGAGQTSKTHPTNRPGCLQVPSWGTAAPQTPTAFCHLGAAAPQTSRGRHGGSNPPGCREPRQNEAGGLGGGGIPSAVKACLGQPGPSCI